MRWGHPPPGPLTNNSAEIQTQVTDQLGSAKQVDANQWDVQHSRSRFLVHPLVQDWGTRRLVSAELQPLRGTPTLGNTSAGQCRPAAPQGNPHSARLPSYLGASVSQQQPLGRSLCGPHPGGAQLLSISAARVSPPANPATHAHIATCPGGEHLDLGLIWHSHRLDLRDTDPTMTPT